VKLVEFERGARVRFIGKYKDGGPRAGDVGFFQGISAPTKETIQWMLTRGEPPQIFRCNGRDHLVLLKELEAAEDYDGMMPTTWDQCEWQPPSQEKSGS
jgi:hypothetical protein